MTDQPNQPPRVLVVGARPDSLGHYIAGELQGQAEVLCAGVSLELVHLDVVDLDRCREVISDLEPTHIVCTTGINETMPFYRQNWQLVARDHMEINFIGPMNLLTAFAEFLSGMPGSYVAISSNSAHIARSSSAAYCASKAALSMGLRCAARDLTRAGAPLRVWGYEPGALARTPMTRAIAGSLRGGVPMSRMLTRPDGLPVADVARIVARDLLHSAEVLHGTVVRLDAGDS